MLRGYWSRKLVLLALVAVSAWSHADTLSEVRERGEFRLGHRESSSPFSYINDKGEAVGYSVDICLKVFDLVKSELKRSDLRLRLVALKPADRIAAVKDGRVDVECGSTTNTVTRQKDVAFSYTTFMAGARLLAKKSSNLKDLTDLRGKTIVVTEKTTTETVIKQLNTERNLGMKIVLAKDHAEGFAKMESGEAAAVASSFTACEAVVFQVRGRPGAVATATRSEGWRSSLLSLLTVMISFKVKRQASRPSAARGIFSVAGTHHPSGGSGTDSLALAGAPLRAAGCAAASGARAPSVPASSATTTGRQSASRPPEPVRDPRQEKVRDRDQSARRARTARNG